MNIDDLNREMIESAKSKFRNLHMTLPPSNIWMGFEKAKRHYFAPTVYEDVNGDIEEYTLNYSEPQSDILRKIYTDRPIAVLMEKGNVTSTSSQPFVMAAMLSDAHAGSGESVLEIGTGSGYNAAVLAEITGSNDSITTVEIDRTVSRFAEENLQRAGYGDIDVIYADGGRGYRANAPYDSVIVTCGAPEIPFADQVKKGGYIALPLVSRGMETLTSMQKIEEDLFRGTMSIFVRFLHFEGVYSDKNQFSKRVGALQRLIESHAERSSSLENQLSDIMLDKNADLQSRIERMNFQFYLAVSNPNAMLYESDRDGFESGYAIWTRTGGVKEMGFTVMFRDSILKWGSEKSAESLSRSYSEWIDMGKPGLGHYTVYFSTKTGNMPEKCRNYIERKNGITWYDINP
ncbi:MAG: protein-L-isoaspartate O-methyltransferase [bacterium]